MEEEFSEPIPTQGYAMTAMPSQIKTATHQLKPFLIMGMIAVACCLFTLLAVKIYIDQTTAAPFEPLYGEGYDKPEAVDLHSVHPGDTIKVTALKCYSEPIQIYGQSNWHRITEPTMQVLHTQPSAVAPKAAGCETKTFSHVLPADLPPGEWELAGLDTARSIDGSKVYTHTWVTERFTVTAAQ